MMHSEANRLDIHRHMVRLVDLDTDVSAFLGHYGVSADRGFLPEIDPLLRLPSPLFDEWESVIVRLPEMDTERKSEIHQSLETLTPIANFMDVLKDHDDPKVVLARLERACLLFVMFANGWIWSHSPPSTVLPASIAQPLQLLSNELGRVPALSYMNSLCNWRRTNPEGPLDLDNIKCINLFVGGEDESWFFMVTIAIEKEGAPVLVATVEAQKAVLRNDTEAVIAELRNITATVPRMTALLKRMREHNRPSVFYNKVRPFVAGTRGSPAHPHGIVFEGVTDSDVKGSACSSTAVGSSQWSVHSYFGGSAAQSSLVAALDASLGISHTHPDTAYYLRDIRQHMPPGHRAFLDAIAEGPSIRNFVHSKASICPFASAAVMDATTTEKQCPMHKLKTGQLKSLDSSADSTFASSSATVSTDHPMTPAMRQAMDLITAYNDCLKAVEEFRTVHLILVAQYILQPKDAQVQGAGTVLEVSEGDHKKAVGTGGTSIFPFLKGCRQETVDQYVSTVSESSAGAEMVGKVSGASESTSTSMNQLSSSD
eukprot:GILJ01004373.1.p1 GENE.GILJ01004373.1~~GILJ01004373.1.p1  ORF type:complete len:566 (+),score=81.95 GILJ01004373.1:76-1698(+)